MRFRKDDDIEVLHTNESQCTTTISTHREVNCTIAQPQETKQQLIDKLHTAIPNLQSDLTDCRFASRIFFIIKSNKL
jgi:hypothetical protein